MDSRTYSPSFVMNSEIWKDAVIMANSKSEDILNLLLDYDAEVLRRNNEHGDSLLHSLFDNKRYYGGKDDKFQRKRLCLNEILLKSRRFNVNAINFKAQTVLHSVFTDCITPSCLGDSFFCRGDHDETFYEAVTLLLNNGANVNALDNDGKTALSIACEKGCISIIRMILDWAAETCTWLDLDSKDLNGRTALMKAAMWKHVDVVKMLLNAGASAKLSDNRGSTALHYALFEMSSPAAWVNYGDFPKDLVEFNNRRRKIVTLVEADQPHEYYKRCRTKLNEDRMKTVDLLLSYSEADVNALDCEGYSPLDIAVATISHGQTSITDSLKQKGATLNAFQPRDCVATNRDCSSIAWRSLLLRLSDYEKKYFISNEEVLKTNFTNLNLTLRKQLATARDVKLRTPLHRAIISRQYDWLGFYKDGDIIIKTLVSFGCGVNDVDIYGRTPLHYATQITLENILIYCGADVTIRDKDGIIAIAMAKMLQGITRKYRVPTFPRDPINTECTEYIIDSAMKTIDAIFPLHIESAIQLLQICDNIRSLEHIKPLTIPEIVWEVGQRACCHSEIKKVTVEVTDFIQNLASAIERQDSRLKIDILFLGSSYEGTKIDYPNEFDFDFVLTKFSSLCEVCQSPELPTGFVRLKRKLIEKDEVNEDECDSFFNENGFLMTEKINTQFKLALNRVLTDENFTIKNMNFDWFRYSGTESKVPYDVETRLATTLKLTKTKLDLIDESSFEEISIDIVPCIHIDGWWPDDTISAVSEEIKAVGCNLVFDYPQRQYPWVPFSGFCAKISFAKAESEMIKRSSDEAKKAYVIGKHMIKYVANHPDGWNTSYILKNSLLYCIETFQIIPETRFDQLNFHVWLECLMKCHVEFILQDFCPCYFMPTFILPVQQHRRSFNMKRLTNGIEFHSVHLAFCKLYCLSLLGLYGSRSNDTLSASDFNFRRPVLNPAFEHFNRETFITDLAKHVLTSLENISGDDDDDDDDDEDEDEDDVDYNDDNETEDED